MKKLTLLTLFSLFFIGTYAQELQIDEISVKGFDGMKEIPGHGFYTYFYKEKLPKGMKNFSLKFFDYDYKEIGSSDIELSSLAFNGGAASNSESVALAFIDPKAKNIQVKSYNTEGVFLGEIAFGENKYLTEEMHAASPLIEVYSLEDGYIIMSVIRMGMMKMNFKITKVTNNMDVVWEKRFEDGKINMVANDILADSEGIYITFLAGNGLSYDNYNDYILKLDSKGKEVFRHEFNEAFAFAPVKMFLEDELLFVFGPYMKENNGKDVLGLQGIVFANDGEKLKSVMVDWEKDILPTAQKMNLEGHLSEDRNPSFFVHDVVKTTDGNYRVITETVYSKVVAGVGVSFSTNSGTGVGVQANTQFKFSDFFIFTFNDDLKNTTIQAVTKKTNKIVLAGVNYRPSRMQKYFGGYNLYNYQFVKKLGDKEYLVYVTRENYGSNVQICVAEISNDEEVKRTLEIQSDLTKESNLSYWDVFNNNENNITVYTYKSKTIKMYNLSFDN